MRLAPFEADAGADLRLIDSRWRAGGAMAEAGERNEEFEDLRDLLLDGAVDAGDPEVAELAATMARACLGHDHLWHDLGLATRDELSRILYTHFPKLAAKNVGRMRWKKFFYKQLCERLEVRACRAPSCGVCANQAECFGPEEVPIRRMSWSLAAPL
jgi:nitrogen fixation protein NifQ